MKNKKVKKDITIDEELLGKELTTQTEEVLGKRGEKITHTVTPIPEPFDVSEQIIASSHESFH